MCEMGVICKKESCAFGAALLEIILLARPPNRL